MTKHFTIKVTTIEEAKDVSNIKLEELIYSLRTFEMSLDSDDHPSREEKNLALQIASKIKEEDSVKDEEDQTESVALLTRNLARVMKKINLKN